MKLRFLSLLLVVLLVLPTVLVGCNDETADLASKVEQNDAATTSAINQTAQKAATDLAAAKTELAELIAAGDEANAAALTEAIETLSAAVEAAKKAAETADAAMKAKLESAIVVAIDKLRVAAEANLAIARSELEQLIVAGDAADARALADAVTVLNAAVAACKQVAKEDDAALAAEFKAADAAIVASVNALDSKISVAVLDMKLAFNETGADLSQKVSALANLVNAATTVANQAKSVADASSELSAANAEAIASLNESIKAAQDEILALADRVEALENQMMTAVKDIAISYVSEGKFNYVVLTYTFMNGTVAEVRTLIPSKIASSADVSAHVSANALNTEVTLSTEWAANAVLPNGTKLNKGATTVTLNVDQLADANPNSIKIEGDHMTSVAYDIEIPEVASNNTGVIVITLKGQLAMHLANVALYHGTDKMASAASAAEVDAHNEYYYDPATGDLTIGTVSFSNFTVVYEKPLVRVGNAFYATLQDAINAAGSGETVVLYGDVSAVGVVVKGNVVIDLNGYTVTGVATNAAAAALITVNAGATLKLCGEGSINFLATKPDTDWGEGAAHRYPGYANNTIANRGTLIVDGPTLVNRTPRGGASYVIDCYSGSSLTVESGNIEQVGGDTAIRMYAGPDTLAVNVTINGGTITGNRAVWLQLPSSNSSVAPTAALVINGGTLASNDATYTLAIYSYSFGNSFANTSVTINGGTFDGNIAFGGGYTGDQESVTINGGEFNGYVGRYLANNGWEYIELP